jgi:hypothetical protein
MNIPSTLNPASASGEKKLGEGSKKIIHAQLQNQYQCPQIESCSAESRENSLGHPNT